MAGPNSLEYMKSYGFKTFGDIWDESYDKESDSNIRFKKITNIITKLTQLSEKEFNLVIEKTKNITKFNREHFYSESFKKTLLNELTTGIDSALEVQEENFHTMPGGTLFYYHNMYYKINNVVPPKSPAISLHRAVNYANKKSPKVANEIIKKYNHLL